MIFSKHSHVIVHFVTRQRNKRRHAQLVLLITGITAAYMIVCFDWLNLFCLEQKRSNVFFFTVIHGWVIKYIVCTNITFTDHNNITYTKTLLVVLFCDKIKPQQTYTICTLCSRETRGDRYSLWTFNRTFVYCTAG